MTKEEAIKIIRNEYLCVDRDCDIEKSCRKCPYAMPTKEPILEAYNIAIKALEHPERNVVAVVPCGDTISRQAVLDELNKWDWQELYLPIHFKENIIDVIPSVNPQKTQMIDKSNFDQEQYKADLQCAYDCGKASVNPQEPKAGHWISHYDEDAKEGWYECDRCHTERAFNTKFCPDCGCCMVEPQESEDKE